MATSNYVLQKVQVALREWLKTQTVSDIPSTSIFAGIQKEKRKVPCVIVYCQSAQAEDHQSGNVSANVTVQVISNWNDTTADEHHARASALSNLLGTDTIAADWSSGLEDFTAFLVTPTSQRFDAGDDHWVSELDFDVICCGSDIS